MNGEEARQHINAIVEKRTQGKIQNILTDIPQPSTNLLLISGIFIESTIDIDNLTPVDNVRWISNSRQNLSKDDGELYGSRSEFTICQQQFVHARVN